MAYVIKTICIVFTRLFQYVSIVTLTFTSDLQINRVHPLIMTNMYGKFEEEASNGLFCTVLCSQGDGLKDSSITISPPKNVVREK